MITDTLTMPDGRILTIEASVTYGDIIVSGLLVFLICILLFGAAYAASRQLIV